MPPSSSAYTAQRPASLASPGTQAFDGLESHHSGSGAEYISPLFAMSRKTAKTSFDNGRNIEAAGYMNKQILQLAQISRDVYLAKMQYQRLRIRELEMMRAVMRNELEETQGYLKQSERQIGQIHHDTFDGLASLECNMGQCTHFRQFATFSRDGSPGYGGAYSARRSEYTVEC